MLSCQAVSTESRSTMTMGVEHFGQRKQVGWVGEEVVAADACGMGCRRAGVDRGAVEWRAGDWPGSRKSGCGQSPEAGRGAGSGAGTLAHRGS